MTGVPYSPVEDVLLPYLRLRFVRKWAGEETRSVTQVRMDIVLCSSMMVANFWGKRGREKEDGWQRLGEGRKGEWLGTFGEIKHGRKEDQLKSKINRVS